MSQMSVQSAPLPPQRIRPSFRSTFRGKHVILASWLATNPFVTSFVEDERRGTAKETRSNTLLNRDPTSIPSSPPANMSSSCQTDTDSSDSSDSSSRSLESIPNPSPTPKRTISFSTKVKVYSLDNPDNPVEEDVKEPSTRPPLEARRKRVRSVPVADIYQPTTAAGRWLLRKTSGSLNPDDPESRA